MQSLKMGKLRGWVLVIQYYYKPFSDVITFILNLIFSSEVFPNRMKEGLVIPQHKISSKQNNFRPISLPSCSSKIFEKIIKHTHKFLRLYTFF